jgi:hypothetical protein
MGDAVGFGVFVARAGLYPNTDGDRSNVLHFFGEHNQTVRQNLSANVSEFLDHGWKPLNCH